MNNFVTAVKAMLNLTDDSKIVRFLAKTQKHLKKQISIRKEEISDLREKLVDHAEAVRDTILDVDFESIQTTDQINSYVPDYVENILSTINSGETIADQIEDLEEEITALVRLIKELNEVKVPEESGKK